MKVKTTNFLGLLEIEPKVFRDERGFFLESYRRERYVEAGIVAYFVQDNHSHSQGGVLRGLHFTIATPQSQLVYVSSGEIFYAAVDLRANSPAFGHWYGIHLDAETPHQIFLPVGFAHGFCVLGDHADVHYKTTHAYNPDDEAGIIWCDPDINIPWPIENPDINDRDAGFSFLRELSDDNIPCISFRGELTDG